MSDQSPSRLRVGDYLLGGDRPLFLICGPCVIESRDHALFLASKLREISERQGINLIFKASYDKANRTSIESFRGPGLDEGLKILSEVRSQTGLPILSDIHETAQVDAAGEVLDVIQIPAFLCRQTDLIIRAAASGKVLNIKKGQFLAPWDVSNVVAKARSAGADRMMVTERGAAFGYNNLVVDFKSLPILRSFGVLAVFDATHSVQLPGGHGASTAGQAEFIPYLARAAAAVGVDGLFLEVHENPAKALSDGSNAFHLDRLESLIEDLKRIDDVIKRSSNADGAKAGFYRLPTDEPQRVSQL